MSTSLQSHSRLHQVVLIASLVPLCWLGMMVVHESGHIAAAWFTGGTVTRVVLHPLTISRTDVAPNPYPLHVVWAGPVVGALLPLFALGVARLARVPEIHLLRFFAGFCFIANGLYLGVGSFDAIGDAGDLLRHGASAWQLWAFGALTVPAGFFLWHGQGKHFGLGKSAEAVSGRAAYLTLALLVALVVIELLLSPSE